MKRNKFIRMPFMLLIMSLTLLNAKNSYGQDLKHHDHDSTFYEIFWHHVTVRTFLAQKYTHFTMPPQTDGTDLQYVANPKLNLGIGVTWHNLSANVFYGFGYLNDKDKPKGETKGLDLQLHLFPHKWVVDMYVVMPKGFHLNPKGFAAPSAGAPAGSQYYYRPDVKERIFGISALRCPNKEKFSYRAALIGNEWQKKSAGSLLYGGHAYYLIMESNNEDSVLVPSKVSSLFPKMAGLTEARFYSFGPGFGGAYTFVAAQHWFLMLSAVVGVDINVLTEEHGEDKTTWIKKTRIAGTVEYKAGMGYNSRTWAVLAQIVGNNFWAQGASTQKYNIMGGQMRFSVSRKIDTKNKHGGVKH